LPSGVSSAASPTSPASVQDPNDKIWVENDLNWPEYGEPGVFVAEGCFLAMLIVRDILFMPPFQAACTIEVGVFVADRDIGLGDCVGVFELPAGLNVFGAEPGHFVARLARPFMPLLVLTCAKLVVGMMGREEERVGEVEGLEPNELPESSRSGDGR